MELKNALKHNCFRKSVLNSVIQLNLIKNIKLHTLNIAFTY